MEVGDSVSGWDILLVIMATFAMCNIAIWIFSFFSFLYDDVMRLKPYLSKKGREGMRKTAKQMANPVSAGPISLTELREFCGQLPGDGATTSILFTREGGIYGGTHSSN